MDETERSRLDVALVKRGLMDTRSQARASIEAGNVRVDGRIARRPNESVGPGSVIEAAPAHPWASRGGLKLAHALDAFGVSPERAFCLDIGASTGGFTDVLLARGARRVVAVDVGRGQLIPRLLADPRVLSLEGQDARSLTAAMIGEAPTVLTVDASFIGLAKVLAEPLKLAANEAHLIALFKPQFEVGPAGVGRGGIVSDDMAAAAALGLFQSWLQEAGWACAGVVPSPIRGGDGNKETLVWARRRN